MVARVVLPDEGEPRQVVEPPALAPAEPLAVEGYVRDRPADRLAEPCELESGARGAPERLGLGVPDHDRRGGAGDVASTLRCWRSPIASRWIRRARRAGGAPARPASASPGSRGPIGRASR